MTRTIDPRDMTWTRGFLDPAHIRQHATTIREMSPTRRVRRGTGAPRELPGAPADLGELPVRWTWDRTVPLSRALAESDTDALVVVHRGRIVHEQYLHGYLAHEPHLNASLTKSYIGLLAALVADQGLIRRDEPAATYVPELAGTGLGAATLQQLLHMTTHVNFGGRPYDRVLEAHRFWAVVSPGLRPAGYTGPTTILDHLTTSEATGPFDAEFRYDNANTEVIAEVLRRVTGLTTAELLGELVWSRIGAAEDAYFVVDSAGAEMACGGFAATALDGARMGEMLRCEGAVAGRQVIPAAVARSITAVPAGPTRKVRLPRDPVDSPPRLGYHDFWWVLDDGSFMASGIHGQRLYVSPAQELVIVHYGAHILSPAVPPPPLVVLFAQLGAALSAG